jgi:hypothetical protein
VTCPTATRCVAVGGYAVNQTKELPLIEIWGGTAWRLGYSTLPTDATGGSLKGVSCVSSVDCLGVGIYDTMTSNPTWADYWDGSAWSVEYTPNPPMSIASGFSSASCPTATRCHAVGFYFNNPQGPTFSLAESRG